MKQDKKFELTDKVEDKFNNGKPLDKSLFFDEDDNDNSKYEDEEFLVGIY